jgi:hypothetical protein
MTWRQVNSLHRGGKGSGDIMPIRFAETTLVEGQRHLRLIDSSGQLLLEMKGHEIDEAIRAGFLDPSNFHFSMYEYARIRLETGLHSDSRDTKGSKRNPQQFDNHFLRNLNIAWD